MGSVGHSSHEGFSAGHGGQQQPCERKQEDKLGGSKVVMFGRDLGCVVGDRAVGRRGHTSGWKSWRWVRVGGVVQGWGQAAGMGRVASCKGSEGLKRGYVG